MAYLEIRRHSRREKPCKHLSQEGVVLARRVGRRMGVFERVVCSPAWRCVETAVAMGFAVDEVRDDLHMKRAEEALAKEVLGLETFEAFAAAAGAGRVKTFAEELRDVWAEIARGLAKEGRGLVVGHGAMIELGAVGALGGEAVAGWGKGLGVCEGVGLRFERGKFVGGEVLRVRN